MARMFEYIKNLFNKPKSTVGDFDLYAQPTPKNILNIIDRMPEPDMDENERRDYVLRVSGAQRTIHQVVGEIIHEHFKFRARNVSKSELVDIMLGAVNMADSILKRVDMLSAEHEQSIEDSKGLTEDEKHPINPVSGNSNSSIDIL